MKERFSTVVLVAAIALAFAGCSRQNSNNSPGTADRTAQPTYTPPTGYDSSHGTEGSTAGAASGSLQTHERGGGSDGTGVATRPEAGAAPNVDSKYEHRQREAPEPAHDPSVPDPQGKQ